jgi:hypothetical protein
MYIVVEHYTILHAQQSLREEHQNLVDADDDEAAAVVCGGSEEGELLDCSSEGEVAVVEEADTGAEEEEE